MTHKRKYEIKIGDVFGKRTVINATFVRNKNSKHAGHILCKCSCGNEDLVPILGLIKGKSDCCKSCGQQKKRYNIDPKLFVGAIFNNRTIIKVDPLQRDKGGSLWVTVKCICGYESLVKSYALLNGKHKICMNCYTHRNNSLLNFFKVGQKIGSRTILDLYGLQEKGKRNKKILCLCDCGYENLVSATWLSKNPNAQCIYCFNKKLAIKNTKTAIQKDIILEDNQSIDSLFDSLLNNHISEKISKEQLKEQQRLDVLHNLNADNIDDIFDKVIDNTDLILNDISEKISKKNRKPISILIGHIFGDRTIIDITPKYNASYLRLVLCKCKCGDEEWVVLSALRAGKRLRCKQCAEILNRERLSKHFPKVGEIFGLRAIIEIGNHLNTKPSTNVKVKCVCGQEDIVAYTKLLNGKANNCQRCKNKKIKG